MTNKCTVCRKWSKKGHGRSFHRFPSNIERKGLWARQLKLNFVGKWSYVCSDHFQETDFKVKPSGVRVLSNDAVPCLPEAFRTQTPPSLALVNSIKREEEHNRAFNVEDVQDVPAFVVVTNQAASIENRSFKVDDVNLPSNELNGDFLSSSIDIKSEEETSGSSTDSVDQETCDLPLSIKEELDPQPIKNSANYIVRRFSSTDIKNDDEFSEPKLKITRQPLIEENAAKILSKESSEPMFNASQASGSRTQRCFETGRPKNVHPQMLVAESPNLTADSMTAKQTIKSPYRKKRFFFGDIIVDDFHEEKGKEFYYSVRSKIDQLRKEINTTTQGNKWLTEKVEKLNTVFKFLKRMFDDLGIDDFSDMAFFNDEDTDSESISSIEDDLYNVLIEDLNDDNAKDGATNDPMFEENVTQYCNFNFANQAQITFLEDNDDNKLKSLKTKIEYFAETDIKQSQKIFQLRNTILVKNKMIEKLKSELSELQNENGGSSSIRR